MGSKQMQDSNRRNRSQIDSQIEQYFNVRDVYIAYRDVRNQAMAVSKSLDMSQAEALVESCILINDGNFQLQTYALDINNFCATSTSDVEYNQATTRYTSYMNAFNQITTNMELQQKNRKTALRAIMDFLQLWIIKLGNESDALTLDAARWDTNMVASWKTFVNAIVVMNNQEETESV